ncbi:hypothetical protein Mapa_001299 [Marchantia paleacea]|nr:hypothetical protein Mapa_001299 [Marchantia paleacea]
MAFPRRESLFYSPPLALDNEILWGDPFGVLVGVHVSNPCAHRDVRHVIDPRGIEWMVVL